MIRFLLKSAFWLGLAFLIMPRLFPSTAENAIQAEMPKPASGENNVGNTDQLIANGKTIYEIGKFCLNNTSVCEGGKNLFASAGGQAMEGAATALDYLSKRYGKSDQPRSPESTSPVATTITSNIPIPTSRETALRELDRRTTGAVQR